MNADDMIHDGMLSGKGSDPAAGERRHGPRVPFPTELVVRWFSDMQSPVRYEIIDAGEGGFRIRTSLPVMEGMTGIAVMLLPEGKALNRALAVAWAKSAEEGFEAGLRFIETT